MLTLTYQTRETPLAVALATCGVPFPVNASGKPIPFYNTYSAVILRAFLLPTGQPRYSGWKLWDAAHDAWKRGLRGRITYNFQRTPLFERLIKLWKQHGQTMEKADAAHQAEMLIGCSPEVAIVVCAQYAKNRKMLTEGWRKVTPFIELIGDLSARREGDKIITTGSFKAISLNASPELRAQVGL